MVNRPSMNSPNGASVAQALNSIDGLDAGIPCFRILYFKFVHETQAPMFLEYVLCSI